MKLFCAHREIPAHGSDKDVQLRRCGKTKVVWAAPMSSKSNAGHEQKVAGPRETLLTDSVRFFPVRGPLLAAALAVSALTQAGVSEGKPKEIAAELVARLGERDFRVRVQAALLLGKTGDARALKALSAATKDSSAAVRAASVAALTTLGDPAAISAIAALEQDENAAVRRQVKVALSSLRATLKRATEERKKAKLLVKMGAVSNRGDGTAEAVGAAALASRSALSGIPEVALLHASEDPEEMSKKLARPVFVLSGSIRGLSAKKEQEAVVVSASVEFLLQDTPEYSIVGKLSGSASVTVSSDSGQAAQETAVSEAVRSALKKSKDALLAAARRS